MSVNKVILLGNLGADPELKYTPTQMAVTNLNIATTDRRKDQSGQWVDQTEWHRVTVFGKSAENCSQYLAKGRQVYIEGKLKTRKWQDKTTGADRYATDIIADVVQFVGGKSEGTSSAPRKVANDSSFSSSGFGGGAGFDSSAGDISLPDAIPLGDDDIPF